MTKKNHEEQPRFIHEAPVMIPEISNISGNKTHLIFKFGYRQNNYDERSYIINSSISLSHEQAKQFAQQIIETLEKLEKL